MDLKAEWGHVKFDAYFGLMLQNDAHLAARMNGNFQARNAPAAARVVIAHNKKRHYWLFVCLLPLIYKVFHAVYCRIERSVWLVGGNTEGLREPEFESECGRTFIQVPTQIKRTLPIRSAKTILIKLGIVRANNLHIS